MNRYAKIFVRLMVSVTLVYIILSYFNINLNNTISEIKRAEFILLAMLIPLVINPLISNNRWKVFLRIQGINEKFTSLVRINFISVFLGFMLPSSTGFDAIRIYMIEKRHKSKLGMGGASVIIERLLGFYMLSFLGLVGAIVAYYSKGVSIHVLYAVLFIHFFVSLVILVSKNKFLFRKVSGVLEQTSHFKMVANYTEKLYKAINTFPIKSTLQYTLPLILLFQLACIICAYLLFIAFGVNVPFYYHMAFLPLILILSIIPVSISGFGIREGGFVYFYNLIGVSNEIAMVVSLLYYAILMLVPALVGMILYLFSKDSAKIETNKSQIYD
jgi:glycosyltransferase 2 family protein